MKSKKGKNKRHQKKTRRTNRRRLRSIRSIRSIRRKSRKNLTMKGGSWWWQRTRTPEPVSASVVAEINIDPLTLPLSIRIHEFAMYSHYSVKDDPDFIFYVQPRKHMARVLDETYGSLTGSQQYTQEDLGYIISICGGRPVARGHGVKIQFSEILKRYGGKIPELYKSAKVGNSFKNEYGFQLLYKLDYGDAIHAFYDNVRELFCKIHFNGGNDYIRKMKTSYEGKLGDKTWNDYDSMDWDVNFQMEDVLKFLVEFINKEDDPDEIINSAKHYVNLFSTEIGDVRICKLYETEEETRNRDMEGTYIIIKLKDPQGEFVYDNTEMVVNRCDFNETTPAQYHLGIMRNPSLMIERQFNKILSPDKLAIIHKSNEESRFF